MKLHVPKKGWKDCDEKKRVIKENGRKDLLGCFQKFRKGNKYNDYD